MKVIEFQAQIKGSSIEVPAEFKTELDEGDIVTVVVKKAKSRKTAATGMIVELMKNPVKFNGAPLTRKEIYSNEFRNVF